MFPVQTHGAGGVEEGKFEFSRTCVKFMVKLAQVSGLADLLLLGAIALLPRQLQARKHITQQVA